MRKLIIATAAVALLSTSGALSGAFAQSTDKAGTAATSGDTMSKSDSTKMTKTKKSSKKAKKDTSGDDAK
jgi:hypothetical protein